MFDVLDWPQQVRGDLARNLFGQFFIALVTGLRRRTAIDGHCSLASLSD